MQGNGRRRVSGTSISAARCPRISRQYFQPTASRSIEHSSGRQGARCTTYNYPILNTEETAPRRNGSLAAFYSSGRYLRFLLKVHFDQNTGEATWDLRSLPD